MSSCAVVNCPNQFAEASENVRFYSFPWNKTIREKWLVMCGRKIDSDVSKLSVCSSHFPADHYISSTVDGITIPYRTLLKPHALPVLNLFQIKQEDFYPDNVEIVEDRTACPNVPSDLSIASCARLDNDILGNSASCESSTDYNARVMPDNALESTSTVVNLKEEPSTSSCINYIPSSLPASQNWTGQHNFNVTFGPQEKTTKGVSWTYSRIKDKLYVGKDMPCPINFSVDSIMSDDVTIRAMALYSSPEHTSEIVRRCINHSVDETQRGVFEAEHLVRCESSMAKYDVDETTHRHSVIVPFENPAVGQQFSTYIYKFACFGSCAGGPNRRPLMLVFSMEKGGEVIGRRKLDVKICACPGRDRKSEEKLLGDQPSPVSQKRKEPELASLTNALEFAQSVSFPTSKKSKATPNEDGHYIVKTRDKECHEFLRQMRKLFEIGKLVKNLSPECKKTLLTNQKRSSDQED